jgi:hypothetical protein
MHCKNWLIRMGLRDFDPQQAGVPPRRNTVLGG